MVNKSIVGAVCLAVVSFNLNAEIISYNGYTRDTNTQIVTGGGLEWLRWGATDSDFGYAANDVISMYASEGWRLASNEEMVQLLEDFNFMTGFTAIEGVTLETDLQLLEGDSYLPYNRFHEFFGITNHEEYAYDTIRSSQAIYGSDDDNDNKFKYVSVAIHGLFDDYGDYGEVKLYRDFESLDSQLDNVTSVALVRESVVPVPAAVWLFCTGLLGLIGVARRKKA